MSRFAEQPAAWGGLQEQDRAMIVDCHTHVRSFEGTEISEHLAAAETVDACIVLASHEGPRDEINRKWRSTSVSTGRR